MQPQTPLFSSSCIGYMKMVQPGLQLSYSPKFSLESKCRGRGAGEMRWEVVDRQGRDKLAAGAASGDAAASDAAPVSGRRTSRRYPTHPCEYAATEPRSCASASAVRRVVRSCTKPYRARGHDYTLPLYRARARASASTVPSHSQPCAVPYRSRASPDRAVPYRTAPGRGRVPVVPPFPCRCRCRSRPVGAEPPVAGAAPGYISSPRRYPAPVPVPMAAAAAAHPSPGPGASPAAGSEQRPDRGGTGGSGTTPGTAPTGSSSSGGGGSSSSPGSVELAAARRRLVAAEGRRRAAAELEGRVLQVHCALRHAELRLAARAEALGRLGAGVAQAQLALAAHTQRLQKGLRRRPRPRSAALLAAARALRSCVPWAPARSRGTAAPPAAARRLPAAPRSPA
ncbi:TMF-regulated nuclear protein 1 [Guaruba guarouba]